MNLAGSGGKSKVPPKVARKSSTAQPRKASNAPAVWSPSKAAKVRLRGRLTSAVGRVASTPATLTSFAIQELMADGVSVRDSDQPDPSCSRDTGGKKRPARADMLTASSRSGLKVRYASSRPIGELASDCASAETTIPNRL